MWLQKYEIVAVEQDNETTIARVTLKYTNNKGAEKIVIERVSDKSKIKQIAENAIRELNRIDEINDFITNPPVGEVSLVPIALTQQQIDEQLYQQKKQELIGLKQDLDLKLIDQTTYDAKVTVVVNLKP